MTVTRSRRFSRKGSSPRIFPSCFRTGYLTDRVPTRLAYIPEAIEVLWKPVDYSRIYRYSVGAWALCSVLGMVYFEFREMVNNDNPSRLIIGAARPFSFYSRTYRVCVGNPTENDQELTHRIERLVSPNSPVAIRKQKRSSSPNANAYLRGKID